MYIAQKIELKPNETTKKLLTEAFGYSRYIYNKALNEWKLMYNQYKLNPDKNKPTHRRIRDNLKSKKEDWELKQQSMILDTACEDLGKSFNMFFKKVSKYPKFKSKKNQKNTCRFYRKNDYSIQIKDGKYLKLPNWDRIKMKEKLKYEGTIKEVTISKKADKYFASFIIDTNEDFFQISNNEFAGVDLGIKTLAVVNDSLDNTYEYKSIIKELIPLYKKIDFYNRNLSKKDRNSKRYQVMKTKLQRLYLRISNIQKDYLHKITTNLVSNYKYITIEDLNVSGMLKNKNLSKSISRSLFYTFKVFLEYKSKMYGNTIMKADRWFPSSQICSHCGNVLEKEDKLKLSDRVYKCTKCGNEIDRDINAAINLKLYGMRFIG